MKVSPHLEGAYHLLPMQEGMLFHTLAGGGNGVYIGQVVARLPQGMDVGAFEKAWKYVVERHAVLRTSFQWEGLDEPMQHAHDQLHVPVKKYDWRNLTAQEEHEKLTDYLANDRNAGFDLAARPLIRLALFSLPLGEYLFVWTHHHALLDGRSRVIVLKEVSHFYEAHVSGRNVDLPLPPAYREYIEWLCREDWTAAKHYWQNLLVNIQPGSALTSLLEIAQTATDERHGEQSICLTSTLIEGLREIAQRLKVTVSILVQAAWALMLSRYGGEEDVVFGETRACRRPDFEGTPAVVGVVMNTVPIRVSVNPDQPFRDLVRDLREQHRALRDHERASLSDIREWIGLATSAEMFDSIVVFEEYELDDALRREGCTLWERGIHRKAPAHYPLVLAGYNKPELQLRILHDRNKTSDALIERMAGHLKRLLEGSVENPEACIGDLPLLTEPELRQLEEWNDTAVAYSSEQCVHELFEAQVGKAPHAVAVVYEGRELSYGELNRRANQLAHYLRELGVKPDDRVAICVERGLEMMVGLLGILKAGGAYVPLDPAYPVERLQFMLKDSAPVVLLTQGHL